MPSILNQPEAREIAGDVIPRLLATVRTQPGITIDDVLAALQELDPSLVLDAVAASAQAGALRIHERGLHLA